ncbi:unnamed protein product [Microthlaspi erraticum]|uniref:Uncharacterized protein n=1 Tax=Microthlaspi erraticum TaxID=1685480 RepID=A0A6D2K4P8_9BRAS|nr:unnamed protein product [Microthlaspi erraticum]
MVTNVAMSSSSPEDLDCVVAVKFFGPQLSFCRYPARSDSEWINLRIPNPSFFSSRVMFSKKDDMFQIVGSGGHLIGYGSRWIMLVASYVRNPTNMFKRLRLKNIPS